MSMSTQRYITIVWLMAVALLLHGCGTPVFEETDGPGDVSRLSQVQDAVPRVEPLSRGGNPTSYVVFGKRYYPMRESRGFVERGIASWYGSKFHGRKTSNGEVYDMYQMTAAHTRLPLPTYVEVTNLENGRSAVVRVNDRGPFHENRIIDLSYAAASRIGMLGKGTALVEVRAIDPRVIDPPRSRVATTPDATVAPSASQPGSPAPYAPRIFLQAGAFSDEGNAQRFRTKLEGDLARSVRISPVDAEAGRVHRVQVGPLASVEIADQVSEALHTLGVANPVVVID
jgi:rare lipoprotein A